MEWWSNNLDKGQWDKCLNGLSNELEFIIMLSKYVSYNYSGDSTDNSTYSYYLFC